MELSVVEANDVVRAYKVAEIRGERAPRVHPVGPSWRFPIEHRGTVVARCRRLLHDAPHLDCTCGFHAVADLDELARVTPIHADSVVLEVELSGTIVEHERGMRSEEQTVVAVMVPERCYRCGSTADRIGVRSRFWHPVCTSCGAAERAIPCDEASSLLGLPVRFGRLEVESTDEWGQVRWMSTAAAVLTVLVLSLFRAVPGPFPWWWFAAAGLAVAASWALSVFVWSARTSRDVGRAFTAQCWLVTSCCAAVLGSVIAR